MTPELYQRLKPLFEAARELSGEARRQYLADNCATDEERRALEALLSGNDQEADTLDDPIIDLKNHFARPPRSFSNGDVILGRFTIVRMIAAGGMGEVYEAEDRLLHGVHVALKTILPHIAGDPYLRKRFQSEVLLAREVSHTNLCPIYDIFHSEEPAPGHLFLTMKLLPGRTLAARFRAGDPISVEDKLAILTQTAHGLSAIHRSGIIHRDIKPSNIMHDGSGANLRLWITDFGLARTYETESTVSGRGSVAGTPGYIAPELFLGHSPSQASDLFAYGIVLHELFTDKKPLTSPDGSSYTISPSLSAPEVPAFCVELITGCIDSDPRRRCEAFEHALETIGGKRDSARFWTRRRFVATAAASIGVAAAGAVWKWPTIENELHPLPRKRFVALLNWPKTSESQPAPMLTGVLTAIRTELARAEAFDRDFLVISPDDARPDLSAATRLKEICDPLGANLVLAASGLPRRDDFELFLRVLDPVTGRRLREKKLSCALAAVATLPDQAVHAAAALLNLNQYLPSKEAGPPPTQSSEAFTALQSAEALMNHPTDMQLDEAILKYRQALDLDPSYALAFAQLAVAYARMYVTRRDSGALDLARANIDHALALDPSLVEGYLARSLVLEWTGDEPGALDQVAKAVQLDPSNPMSTLQQAQIYTRMGKWEEAESAYHKVLEMRPNWWVTYSELGYTFDRQGKYREALKAFRAASAAAPGNAFALFNLGTEYLAVADFAEALEGLKKSLALDPNYDLTSANISLALRCQGKYKSALSFALKAVELNPANDMNWAELGDCYSSLGDRKSDAKNAYLRAAKETERHLQTDPTDGPSWMTLALYKVKSGTPQDALSLIQKADSLGASDVDSQLCKARVFELFGKRDQALATLAICFSKGATDIQLIPFPDMESLRKDARYVRMTHLTERQETESS